MITSSILLNVGMGVVLTVLMSVFYPVILRFLNLSGQVRSYAGEYLGVLNRFLWVQLLYFIFSAVLKSYGRTTQCMYVFSVSLGQGTAIMIGWSAGVGEYGKADEECRFAGKYTFAFSMAMMAVMFVFRNRMFSLFTSDPEILVLAGTVLLANFLLECGRSQNLVYVASLRAVGDVKFLFYIGIVSMWCVAVGGSCLLGIVLHMGLLGVWIAQGMDECLRAAAMWIRWKRKGYTQIEGVDHGKNNAGKR